MLTQLEFFGTKEQVELHNKAVCGLKRFIDQASAEAYLPQFLEVMAGTITAELQHSSKGWAIQWQKVSA